MESLKKFGISDIVLDVESEDVEFSYADIWFLAEGNNSHKNPIDIEVLKRDAHTILGKFLIYRLNPLGSDFMGHEVKEYIAGYFDPREQIRFEEKDGKTFAVAKATISKIYAKEVVELFKESNGRSVSVEMMTVDGDKDAFGDESILAFNITGCTILGKDVKPSCKGAEMVIKQFAESINVSPLKQFADKRKELKESDKMKGTKEFAINIGELWCTVYNLLEVKYPDSDWGSIYRIDGIYEENGSKFAIIHKKDETKQYKLELIVEEESIGLGEDCIEVEQTFIEKGEVKKFEEPDGVDLSKFKLFEENQPKNDDNEEEKGENDKGEDNKELSDTKPDDKEFSLDVNYDQAAYLEMLENETEDNKTLATELWEAKDYNLVMSKTLEVSKQLAECQKELSELKQYKADQDDKAKTLAVEKQLSEVKGDLTPEKIKEFQESAKEYTLDNLNVWMNGVKAFAYEVTKGKPSKKNDITRIGENALQFQEKPSMAITPEDVFQKYLG